MFSSGTFASPCRDFTTGLHGVVLMGQRSFCSGADLSKVVLRADGSLQFVKCYTATVFRRFAQGGRL